MANKKRGKKIILTRVPHSDDLAVAIAPDEGSIVRHCRGAGHVVHTDRYPSNSIFDQVRQHSLSHTYSRKMQHKEYLK